MVRKCIILLGVAIAGATANAAAEEVVVRIDRTQLMSEYGTQKAYKAMKRAAENACGVGDRATLRQERAAKRCANELLDDLVADANQPVLTAAHGRAPRRYAEAR